MEEGRGGGLVRERPRDYVHFRNNETQVGQSHRLNVRAGQLITKGGKFYRTWVDMTKNRSYENKLGNIREHGLHLKKQRKLESKTQIKKT